MPFGALPKRPNFASSSMDFELLPPPQAGVMKVAPLQNSGVSGRQGRFHILEAPIGGKPRCTIHIPGLAGSAIHI